MRHHPLTIGFRLYNFIKSMLFLAIILFVVNGQSESWFFKYGRYAFLAIVFIQIVNIVMSWYVEKYEWKNRAFHLRKGIFVKQTSTIPFSRIQNVTRKTTLFHKVVGLTSVTFETAMDGDNDSIQFAVLTKKHADFLIELVESNNREVEEPCVSGEEQEEATVQEIQEPKVSDRTIHFTPRRKDLWKASFTSLSFLAIIPIVLAGLDYVEPFLPENTQLLNFYQDVLTQKWALVIAVLFALCIAVVFGVVKTFIQYGKYEISSSRTHIYIHRGVLDESYFAIEKGKIQGLELKQTFMKRLFGLAEVTLISSAKPTGSDKEVKVNSLYPFLPLKKAYELIEEILPTYKTNVELERLPRNSLWVKLLRPSWLWIIATVGLVYFKPELFDMAHIWWMVSIVLLVLIMFHRILDYMHTRYAVTEDQVQWWHGGLTSRMFMTKRKHVIEMSYIQSPLQRIFHVASITTMNRSTPVHIEEIQDISVPYARSIKDWYFKRQGELSILNKKD